MTHQNLNLIFNDNDLVVFNFATLVGKRIELDKLAIKK